MDYSVLILANYMYITYSLSRLTFVRCLVSQKYKAVNITFRTLYLFPPSGQEVGTCPLSWIR